MYIQYISLRDHHSCWLNPINFHSCRHLFTGHITGTIKKSYLCFLYEILTFADLGRFACISQLAKEKIRKVNITRKRIPDLNVYLFLSALKKSRPLPRRMSSL